MICMVPRTGYAYELVMSLSIRENFLIMETTSSAGPVQNICTCACAESNFNVLGYFYIKCGVMYMDGCEIMKILDKSKTFVPKSCVILMFETNNHSFDLLCMNLHQCLCFIYLFILIKLDLNTKSCYARPIN